MNNLLMVEALLDGEPVPITEAEPGEEYECIQCGGQIKVNTAHTRGDTVFVRKHYSHLGDSCGYQSPTHKQMKVHAYLYACERWPEATVLHEDADSTTLGDKIPDLRVDFDDPDIDLGNGVCIECQYKNKSKDIAATDEYYADHGYSTMWTWDHEPTTDDAYDMHKFDWTEHVMDHSVIYPHQDFEQEQVVIPVTFPPEYSIKFVPDWECETHEQYLPDRELVVVPVTTVTFTNSLSPMASTAKGDVTYWNGFEGRCEICGGGPNAHANPEAVRFKEEDVTAYWSCIREEYPGLYSDLQPRYHPDTVTEDEDVDEPTGMPADLPSAFNLAGESEIRIGTGDDCAYCDRHRYPAWLERPDGKIVHIECNREEDPMYHTKLREEHEILEDYELMNEI